MPEGKCIDAVAPAARLKGWPIRIAFFRSLLEAPHGKLLGSAHPAFQFSGGTQQRDPSSLQFEICVP
jgi:hypothetical protein